MPGRYRRITPEKRRQIMRMRARGASYREIARALDQSFGGVKLVLQPLGGVIRKDVLTVSDKRLSLEERIEIRIGIERRMSFRRIARSLGRNVSTISREVNANGGRHSYRPIRAQERALDRTRRPKPTKLVSHPKLLERVVADLEGFWSPLQIATRLRKEFGDDDSMRISHETIYKSLYVQGRGELRRELARCLRSGRAKRVSRGHRRTHRPIPDMVMISERPPEIEDRAVPGHWEGDLLLGREGKSAIGTLVERTTRYVMLFRIPKQRTAEQVREAMTETIQTLPEALRRSLTWDQGGELAQHVRFTVDTGVQIYFCDPHSPWQRGSNENTNGLLRQYFPKGTSLRDVTDEELQRVADSLNNRPRQTLDWSKPKEKLAELVAWTG